MRRASISRPESVFVEDSDFRFEHSHLENLVAFLLTARESLVEGAREKIGVYFKKGSFFRVFS